MSDKTPIETCIEFYGAVAQSYRDKERRMEFTDVATRATQQLSKLTAQRDRLLEACKQILPWARQARFDCDFYSQAAADAQRIIDDVESAIAACES